MPRSGSARSALAEAALISRTMAAAAQQLGKKFPVRVKLRLSVVEG